MNGYIFHYNSDAKFRARFACNCHVSLLVTADEHYEHDRTIAQNYSGENFFPET